MNWTDAQNWIDILDHALIGLVLIAVAGIPSYFAAKNGRGIKKITDQVVNGHSGAPPLREDLDKVIKTVSHISAQVDDVDRKVCRLTDDLELEQRRRQSSDVELRDDFERRFSDFINRFLR